MAQLILCGFMTLATLVPMESLQDERSLFYLFMQESKQIAHQALTRAFLQPAPTATMHCDPEGCTHPLPPVPLFLLEQNLSYKRITPTDNMWPKSDDTKKRHWRLKG